MTVFKVIRSNIQEAILFGGR